MTKPNRMLEALAKSPRLRVVDDPEAVLGGHGNVRLDGWENEVTGQGTSRDKTSFNSFNAGRVLQEDELSALYHGNDVAQRMVDIVPDEMLREGFDVQLGDPGLDQRFADKIEGLGLDDKIANGIRWGRLFGGGGLLLGCDDGRSAAAPLVPEKAKALSYVYEFDRRYLWPLTWYNEAGNPKLGQPETYMVTSPSAYTTMPVAIVHESRLILFGGSPTGLLERQMNFGWDLSVLQRATEVLGDFGMAWRAVALLLADGNQAVFKMAGLADAIAAGSSEVLLKRYAEMDRARSIVRATVIDAGESAESGGAPPEEFERKVFPMTGIPETLQALMLRLASTVRIPVTILMGQSPAGMNATGESDFRWFYDQIKSDQKRKLTPRVRRLARIILATKEFAGSKAVETVTVKYPVLWSETPLAAAQTQQAKATTDKIRIDSGELLPEEVALQRGQPDGYERDIVLTPEGVKVREAIVKGEYASLTPDPTKKDEVPNIELAPTDAANVIKVNEARASLGLEPLEGEDGELTLAQFKAKSAPPSLGFGGGPPRPGGFPPSGGPPKPPPTGAPPEPGREQPQPPEQEPKP